MKNTYNKILPIIVFLTLVLSFNISKAATGTPATYFNTIYAVNLCGPGSSLTACLDPVVLGTNVNGTTFDLGTITAGASAGALGNLNKAQAGVTYSFAQIVLSRAFTMTGTVGSCVTKASTDFNISSPTVVGGASSGTAVSQIIGIPTGDGVFGTNMVGTTSTNGINGADNPDNGNIDNGEPNMKFRFALATPLTLKNGRLPTFEIAFDLSAGISFSANCTSSVTPGAPAVTASFK